MQAIPSFGIFKRKMPKNTSISLGEHFEEYVTQKVQSGSYSSVSEVIRAGLRLLESEEKKISELRQALIVGEESNWVEDFDPVKNLEKLHKSVKRM